MYSNFSQSGWLSKQNSSAMKRVMIGSHFARFTIREFITCSVTGHWSWSQTTFFVWCQSLRFRVVRWGTSLRASGQSCRRRAVRPPLWKEYKELFESCDTFNRMVSNYKWPLRRSHWTHCIDHLFVTSMFINVFSVFKSSDVSQTENFPNFSHNLAIDVINKLLKYLSKILRRSA